MPVAPDQIRRWFSDLLSEEPHDNDAHEETYAVDGDEQPPENHGDDWYIEEIE